MPSAEIISIGTELLLGDIVDTNSSYLSRQLREAGIDLFRKTTVGDNVRRIAQVVREALERCDIIITTGGLGPTVDDPTRDAIALAVGIENEFHPELWEHIQERFKSFNRVPTENNRRQAYIPSGARPMLNPVGTAPIFILEYNGKVIASLPGVPGEMEYLLTHEVLPYLRQHFNLQAVIQSRVLHTVGVGESQVDELIAELETLENPTVGLLAHSGQVDIRITAKAGSPEAVANLIEPIETQLRRLIGEYIYGEDDQTLEEAVMGNLVHQGWSIAVVEAGLNGNLTRRLSMHPGPFLGGKILQSVADESDLLSITEAFRQAQRAEVGFGVMLFPSGGRQEAHLQLITPHETKHYTRYFGGPPQNAPAWAVNQSLDIIRRISHD